MSLDQFLHVNKPDILRDLKRIIRDCKPDLKANPELYIENGCDEPSIDVRLCVDPEPDETFSWILRVGSPDYDQRHSVYCSAGSIGILTKAESLFEQLVREIES
jgi:hypothetical protein